MKRKKKGGVWPLLILLYAAFCCCVGTASAAAPELTFALDAEGAEISENQYVYRAASAGETVTVRFSVLRTDSDESFALFALQNEIEFDMDFFTFVEGSIVKRYANADAVLQTRVRGQQIVKTASLGGPACAAEQPFCEFQLRIRDDASGTGWVRCSRAAAVDTGYNSVTVTERNLTVSIGDAPVTPQYTVRFNADGGFLASGASASVTADTGTRITLPGATRSGYTLTGWSDGKQTWQGTYSNDNAEDITLTAVWKRTASTGGGSTGGGGSGGGGSAGSAVTAAPTPVPSPTAAPAAATPPTLTPTAAPSATPAPAAVSWADCPKDGSCPLSAFSDLSPAAWYHDGVHFCVEQGIMNGFSDETFGPQRIITRAQLATILWNRAGKPEADAELTYQDVDPDGWYAGAIRWALRENLLTGYTPDSFGPNDVLTRQQLAAILYRRGGSPVLPDAAGKLSGFEDREQLASYALDAMAWAVDAGLIQGTTPVTLNPRGSATRAQTAVIIMRCLTGEENGGA